MRDTKLIYDISGIPEGWDMELFLDHWKKRKVVYWDSSNIAGNAIKPELFDDDGEITIVDLKNNPKLVKKLRDERERKE